MRITPIPPNLLNPYITRVTQKKTTKTRTVSKKGPSLVDKEKDINTSLNSLKDTLGIDPDYDPQIDMTEARFKEAYAKIDAHQREYQPNKLSLSKGQHIQKVTKEQAPLLPKNRLSQDKFTYFTLIEALIYHDLLYEEYPHGELSASYATYKINKGTRQLLSELQISKGKTPLKRYRLTYDILSHTYTINELQQKKQVGKVRFSLAGTAYLMEEAKGTLYGKPLVLDPVWKSHQKQIIGYQRLQIGHRTLDLTSPSKYHRKGSWSFKANEHPIRHELTFDSYDVKKNHILTRKKVTMGPHQLSFRLKFLNDCFSEPYAMTADMSLS
ncbi:hypothetical protein DID77_03065 [Candidatus Marinamargulisbacteria bacterium SCGC AG-439-L15]|nr:hypothetical protein DID77_03065 [Candidatus Marinamargulisbacteria bacterium SCGC AG-439-L15]